MNLKQAEEARERRTRAGVDAIAAMHAGAPLHIFGTTTYAQRVAAYARSHGNASLTFIDDGRAGQRFMDAPVVAIAQAPASGLVIGCVVEGRPKTVHRLLEQAGVRAPVDYYNLNAADPDSFPVPFWRNNVDDINAHQAEYAWLRERLEDDASRMLLDDLLRFRYANDPLSGGLTYRLHEQYWEPFINWSAIRSFVDGGSFDGKTALQFIERTPGYERVDVFEPFPASMANAQRTLHGQRDAYFHPYAILDQRKALRFTSGAGSANGLNEGGDIEVLTCALDDELRGMHPGMIKLDIEGAEPEAIDGAQGIIREQRPVLAVCVYHDQSHFWRIPRQVLALRPDYRVRLCHYSEGVYETVMYFY